LISYMVVLTQLALKATDGNGYRQPSRATLRPVGAQEH
jgi:hypothetical protein